MNILSRIRDIRPRVKYMMSRIRDYRPMSVNTPRKRFTDKENQHVVTRLVSEVNSLKSKIPVIQVRGKMFTFCEIVTVQ